MAGKFPPIFYTARMNTMPKRKSRSPLCIVLAALLLAGCHSVGVGISVPLGGSVSIGVGASRSVGSSGAVGLGVTLTPEALNSQGQTQANPTEQAQGVPVLPPASADQPAQKKP
jgi:hypothetical protein